MTNRDTINRRRCERFALPPMYTTITVWVGGDPGPLHGHAYDISESGVRFELDERLKPGSQVSLAISLPGQVEPVSARGRIIWCFDADDDPGPARMAVELDGFADEANHERLMDFLGAGLVRRAA